VESIRIQNQIDCDKAGAEPQPNEMCSGCGQRSSCGSVYQKLGTARGPSVLGKSLIAFVLPIVLFLLALAASDRLLRGRIEESDLRMLAGILPSLVVSIAGVWAARKIFMSRAECDRQGEPSLKLKA
jgi:hypothetical protein